jgi:hypothetical protein
MHLGPPKTEASRPLVALPPAVILEVKEHLTRFARPRGVALSRHRRRADGSRDLAANLVRATHEVGLTHLRLHDLRHTGNTIAAATGASTKEPMARMGHASARAALIYQHATATLRLRERSVNSSSRRCQDSGGSCATDASASLSPRRSHRVVPWSGLTLGASTPSCATPRADSGVPWIARVRPEHDRPTATNLHVDLQARVGAGDGNRTRMTSLEGWDSAIELHPRVLTR